MSEPNAESATFTEKLVAYLDGELPESAARDVEQTLSSDPAVRAEVEKLNRAWDLLDLLPRPTASGEFSSRTLVALKTGDVTAEVAPTLVLSQPAAAKPTARWTLIAWGAGLLLITALSFTAARQRAQTNADPLVDHLPLIERLDVYSEIGDVQFLEAFQSRGFPHEPPPPERR